jgi:hypothetical protein
MSDLTTAIWRSLKSPSRKGRATFKEIMYDVGNYIGRVPGPEELQDALDRMIDFVPFDGGKYRIRVWLMPVIARVMVGDYDWGRIQKEMPSTKTIPMTGKYTSPFVRVLPFFQQAGRGTCVGHGYAYWMMANYYAVNADLPTAEEMAMAQRDVLTEFKNADGSTQCKMYSDAWWRTVLSPQAAYEFIREVGNCTFPEGAFVSDGPKAMRDIGICEWQECLTPKTNTCTPPFHPLGKEETKARAGRHRIEGWAVCTNFDDIMRAIASSGGRGVVLAVNLWEDYVNPDGNGCLRVHIGETPIGSHALFFAECDFDAGIIWCTNSWDKFERRIGITRRYWEVAGGPAYIPIDSTEVLIGKTFYSKVTFRSNVPVWFAIDGERRTESTEFSASLELNRTYLITAEPRFPTQVKEKSLAQYYTAKSTADSSYDFVFTPVTTPGPGGNETLGERIRKLIAAILAKIRGQKEDGTQ